MDVGGWLRSLGLEQYEAAFRENRIDDAVLPRLTAEDLKDLGVGFVGDRRKLLDAIATLRAEVGISTPLFDAPPAIDKAARDAAERRQVTVMFSDLVGSTALSARMDPEDLREVISAYQRCVAETVRRCDGFVAKYMGDGVLSYFGYPQAHEDDAERAVRAGLQLIAAVTALKLPVPLPLQTRVGIATGLVVVGDLIGSGEAQERGIVGETPNLAARLQGIAEPNMVVIADSTRRLLGNFFEIGDLGARDLKGMAGPVRVWTALRPASVESRFEALHASDLTELVGREEELDLLLRRWSKAKSGNGQVVLLSGEAGIGKSRLTAALLERLANEPHTRLRYFCSPQHTDSAFYPFISQMERAVGFAYDDTPQAKLDKLDAVLAQSVTPRDAVALFAEMLSLPNDGRYPTTELAPQQRRQKTLEALTTQLETLSRTNPVLMIFEDMHWIDPTSLEAVGRAVERIRALSGVLIITYRPEFESPWIGQPHVTALTLDRLAEREIATLIDGVTGSKQLSAGIRKDIIERADGIPLFVEEMTRAALEAGEEAEQVLAATASPSVAVPASLHASLMARLDRLGPAKELAQVGAAIGREFSYALLATVAGKSEAELMSALDRLVAAGLLFRQGVPPHATYLFKHALVRDASYGTLLREPRRVLHARIVAALEKDASVVPEAIAHHLAQAGDLDRAASFWLTAGKRCAKRSANIEAITHFKRGIGGLQSLPETPERARRELDFQLAIGAALMGMWNAGEAERAYRRALALCEAVGEHRRRFDAVWGLWLTSVHVQRDFDKAAEYVTELFRIAEQLDDEALRLQAHHAAWPTRVFLGQLPAAHNHVRDGISIYDPAKHRDHALSYAGHDPGVCGHAFGALSLWLLGYPEQATQNGRSCLELAEKLRHSPSLAFALCYGGAAIGVARGEPEDALRDSERLIGVATEHALGAYLPIARTILAWALAKQGRWQQALPELRSGLTAIDIGPLKAFRAMFKAMLVEVYRDCGESAAGMIAVADAMQAVEMDHEVFWQGEILRLRGEILLLSKDPSAAERSLRQALEVSRKQSAKSLELRAAMSLARLWRDQGKVSQARELLAPVYGWFTEGFDTRDLKEAKALLEDLA